MQKQYLLKTVSAGVMALSAGFFFLPYFGVSAFDGILGLFGLREISGTLSEISDIFSFFDTSVISSISVLVIVLIIVILVLPLLLTLISAIIMSGKFSISKGIASTILCAVAFFIYTRYFGFNYTQGASGLIGNMAIALIGTILSIVNTIVFIVKSKSTISTINQNQQAYL
jgi:hypothetical protein